MLLFFLPLPILTLPFCYLSPYFCLLPLSLSVFLPYLTLCIFSYSPSSLFSPCLYYLLFSYYLHLSLFPYLYTSLTLPYLTYRSYGDRWPSLPTFLYPSFTHACLSMSFYQLSLLSYFLYFRGNILAYIPCLYLVSFPFASLFLFSSFFQQCLMS